MTPQLNNGEVRWDLLLIVALTVVFIRLVLAFAKTSDECRMTPATSHGSPTEHRRQR